MSETKVKPVKKKMNKAQFKEHCWGLAFVSPPFIGFLIFMAFPIVFAFVASLTKWNGMNDMMANFVGAENYIKLLGDEKFWKVLFNTVIYMIGYSDRNDPCAYHRGGNEQEDPGNQSSPYIILCTGCVIPCRGCNSVDVGVQL